VVVVFGAKNWFWFLVRFGFRSLRSVATCFRNFALCCYCPSRKILLLWTLIGIIRLLKKVMLTQQTKHRCKHTTLIRSIYPVVCWSGWPRWEAMAATCRLFVVGVCRKKKNRKTWKKCVILLLEKTSVVSAWPPSWCVVVQFPWDVVALQQRYRLTPSCVVSDAFTASARCRHQHSSGQMHITAWTWRGSNARAGRE